MRLRNIPRAESVLANSEMVIKDERHFRGKWNSEIFHNNHPLHIEVGMGKGQFILTLAEQNPDINYIGIERYSSVLLRAVEKLEVTSDSSSEETVTLHLPNLRFICMDATDLPEVFAENEVSRIYLNFSDPWPKARHARRRLTSAEFLPAMTRSSFRMALSNLKQTTEISLISPPNSWKHPTSGK